MMLKLLMIMSGLHCQPPDFSIGLKSVVSRLKLCGEHVYSVL